MKSQLYEPLGQAQGKAVQGGATPNGRGRPEKPSEVVHPGECRMTTPNPKPQPPTVAQQNSRVLRARFPEDQLRDRISALEARDKELNRLREENERLSADLRRVVDRNSGLVSERDDARTQLAERDQRIEAVEEAIRVCERNTNDDSYVLAVCTRIRTALIGGSDACWTDAHARADRVAWMLAEAQGLSDVPDWLRAYVEEGMLPAKDSAT